MPQKTTHYGKSKHFYEHWVFFLLLFLGLAVLHALRFIEHFRHPTIWAEEGAVFLPSWLSGKWQVIYAGYITLFTFLTVAVGSEISLQYLPLFLSTVAVFVAVGTFSYLLLPHWERILPFQYRLALVVFFLGFSPYLEGIAICEYALWYFGIGSGLLALELLLLPQEASRHRWLKCLYVCVGALDGPAVFQVCLPLFMMHFAIEWKRKGVKAAFLRKVALTRDPLIITLLISGAIQFYFLMTHTEGRSSVPLSQWTLFPKAALNQIQMRILVPSLLSNGLTIVINSSPLWATVARVLVVVPFSMLFFQRKSERKDLVTLFLGAGLLSIFVLYLGRGEIFDGFRFHAWDVLLGGTRYSFVPGFLLLTGFTFAIYNLKSVGIRKVYLGVLGPLLIVSGVLNYSSIESADEVGWEETARQLSEYKKGLRDSVTRPIMPPGWGIYVKRPTKD